MKLPHYAPSRLISAVVLMVGQAALAQQAPSAGSQLLQIPAPPAIQAPKPDMRIELDTHKPAADSDTSKVIVKELRLTGVISITEAELIRVSGFVPGSQFTVGELRRLASKITSHYRSLGYFLAQTFLPAQDITEGVVQLTVSEGQYGQIKLQNQSQLSDSVANSILAGLKGADAVTSSALERRILMLSDLPGISVKSTLAPSTSIGATDLIVDITPGQRVSGSVEADNQGNRYTGANRMGASVSINELAGLGDVASARFLTSGEGLAYARASYQVQAGQVNVGLAYTAMNYKLGAEFASTQSNGTAGIGSVYASYPLIRSRNKNLTTQLSFDNKSFSDVTESSTPGIRSDKDAQISSVGLKGDFRDGMGNGLSNYSLSWVRGNINLQTPIVLANDAISAQSNGTFDKVAYAYSRQQEITAGTGLYFSLYGQWASKNLDSSEKFSLGGAGGVRAFPSGEASGDEGMVLTLETRTRLPVLQDYLPGQMQLVGFVDTGVVTLNKNPWDAAMPINGRRLSGVGLGINYFGTNNLMVKASWAFKVGDESATSVPDASGRFWLQVNKSF